ncbi:hypothetical protein ACQCT5_22225 [Sutcliffiella halmapala]
MAECNCCKSTSNIACNIGSFNSEERIRYDELRKDLNVNRSIEEIPNGYTFIYPNQPTLLLKIVELISYENRCCPFIEFSLKVSGEADVIRLDLTGNQSVKDLLKEEFRLG